MEQWIELGWVAAAAAIGGVVGFEREQADKAAGLRTHMLVAAAAALIVELGRAALAHHPGTGDPNRALNAIVTGIGFLGAGTIILRRDGRTVEGLTTAASLLFVASLGIAVAYRKIWLAVGAALLVLLTLRFVGYVEHRSREPS